MPSIEQFRNVIKNVKHMVTFTGFDANGDPIHDRSIKAPILKAIGTIKLHGTNAAVCYNDVSGMWFQSKENIITPQNDNAGFAFFGTQNNDTFLSIIKSLNIDTNKNTVTVYGEWAGKGIQKGVGISEIEKSFFIIGIKVTPFNEEESAFWLEDYKLVLSDNRIFDIRGFKTFEIEIDFENALFSQNKMVDWVMEVENECPVAKEFGISGIGEGIVFSIKFKDSILRWKMKGDKHAGKSKVKVAKKVDDVRLQLIIDIVNQVTPEWRLAQMYDQTFDTLNGGKGSIEKMGDYIRSVINDIIKEDSDIISDAGLIPKDVNANISKIAREWLVKKLDEEAGLV